VKFGDSDDNRGNMALRIADFLLHIALVVLTVLIWQRFGFVGLLAAMAIGFAVGLLWSVMRRKWTRRKIDLGATDAASR
jgi:hypothetical protein